MQLRNSSEKARHRESRQYLYFQSTLASLQFIYDHTQDKALPNNVSIRGVEHHLYTFIGPVDPGQATSIIEANPLFSKLLAILTFLFPSAPSLEISRRTDGIDH